jgi:hypothetical protein
MFLVVVLCGVGGGGLGGLGSIFICGFLASAWSGTLIRQRVVVEVVIGKNHSRDET